MQMLDISQYVVPTRFSGLSGVFLARALLRSAPDTPSARVHQSLIAVREAAEHLRAVVRGRMQRQPSLRPLDARLDAGWVAMRESIEARSRLLGTDLADEAAKLLSVVFPDGTNFVRMNYREQWAASQLHLERIREEDLAGQVEQIAGTGYLEYVEQAHLAFGKALGLGEEPPPNLDTTALQRATTELAHAIADYGRVLAGELDRTDDESMGAFKQAMAPIDAQRRVLSRNRDKTPEPTIVEDEQPSPDVDLDEPMPVVVEPLA